MQCLWAHFSIDIVCIAILECHESCQSTCSDGTPKGCDDCNTGYIDDEERGCIGWFSLNTASCMFMLTSFCHLLFTFHQTLYYHLISFSWYLHFPSLTSVGYILLGIFY